MSVISRSPRDYLIRRGIEPEYFNRTGRIDFLDFLIYRAPPQPLNQDSLKRFSGAPQPDGGHTRVWPYQEEAETTP